MRLRVCDISCGSGHILLAAARRIGLALAIVRTGDDQPSPAALREATRDVIKNCIYGVDLNPLAVELCKVALWLEAHSPGEPLNFLDHHIKCGNAIVGFVTQDELEKGVPDEAFKTLPGDDKDIAAAFRKTNKTERKDHASGQKKLKLAPALQQKLDAVLARWREISALPEHTPTEIAAKKRQFDTANRQDAYLLRQIAAIPVAQFYQPKTAGNKANLITDASYRAYLAGQTPQGQATASAWHIAERKRAFHWFLEFPDIIARGGFDCILGNPPYLGGTHLSGTYGHPFCEYVRWQYAPTGLSDLVAFFIRRIFTLLRPNGFTAFITTNSIKDGDIRKDGLEQVIATGGVINMAVRGIKWPGVANLVVSLVSIHRGEWKAPCYLDGSSVEMVSAFFESTADHGEPSALKENQNILFEGSKFLGDGFLLEHRDAAKMVARNSSLKEVIFPVINGGELNNQPSLEPGRSIINFFDWPLEKASNYGEAFAQVLNLVKPVRDGDNRAVRREKWWQYAERAIGLYRGLHKFERCFAAAATTKHLSFVSLPSNIVYTQALKVFTTDRWDRFAVVQSTIHEVWARKYSGALKQDLRYSPSKCFDTFAFPAGLMGGASSEWRTANGEDVLASSEQRTANGEDVSASSEQRTANGEDANDSSSSLHSPLTTHHSPGRANSEQRMASGGEASGEQRMANGEDANDSSSSNHSPLTTHHSPAAGGSSDHSLLATHHSLARIGERYHEFRRDLMLRLWLGLTDIYNLFHAPALELRLEALFKRRAANSEWRVVEKVPTEHVQTAGSLSLEEAIAGIKRLRQLHVELDYTVLAAYGWGAANGEQRMANSGDANDSSLSYRSPLATRPAKRVANGEQRMVKTFTTLLLPSIRHSPLTTRQKSCYRTISTTSKPSPKTTAPATPSLRQPAKNS